MGARETILDLKQRMGRSIIGQEQIIERLLIGLLANGNLLVEGLPGLAKTRAVKSLAKHLEAGLSRIQFTPDLLPSDITGTEGSRPTRSSSTTARRRALRRRPRSPAEAPRATRTRRRCGCAASRRSRRISCARSSPTSRAGGGRREIYG